MNILDMPVIQKLIVDKTARPGLLEFSGNFDAYVTQLPWEISGNRLDWAQIPNSICIEWDTNSDEEIKSFIDQTNINNYKEIAVVFSAKQPALICSYDFVVENLDIFFFHFHGAAYFVGYDEPLQSKNEGWDFLEVEIGGKICGKTTNT